MNSKRIISVLLCLIFLFSICPPIAFAVETGSGNCGSEGASVTWEMKADGTLTIRGSGRMADYPYPAAVPWDYDSVKTLVVESGVTHLASYTCYGDDYLQSVSLPETITSIGDECFRGCSKLTEFVFPKKIAEIGNRALRSCDGISSITFPKTVRSIGEGVLGYCDSLQNISVESGNSNYISIDGVLLTKDKKILIAYPAKKDAVSYTIPNGVTRIGESAFAACDKLETINVPSTVSSIGNDAFSYCYSLKEMIIPVGVTSIEDYTFYDCTSLQSCEIPEGVVSIEGMAFDSCIKLESVSLPSTLESIGGRAFDGCISIQAFEVAPGNSHLSSEDGVLYNAEKTHLKWYPAGNRRTVFTIPDTVTNIEWCAFNDSKYLNVVIIPDSVKYIADNAFMDCAGLTSVTIPASVTSLGSVSFYGCKNLTIADIQANTTSIPYIAFDGCVNLQKVYIPKTVTSIGYGAFDDCDSLTDIYFGGSEEEWTEITINSSNEALLSDSVTIHYNCEKLEYDNGICKFCGQLHNEYFVGGVIKLLHTILYFVRQYLSQLNPFGLLYSRDFTIEDVVTEEDGVMQYVRNEVLIVANESASFEDIDAIAKSVGGEIVGCIEITGDYQVAFERKSETELKGLIDTLKKNSSIDDAMLNYVTEVATNAVSVNDGWGGDDWSESNPSGKNWGLEAIRARDAWEYANQMSDIKIGIIDNGFDLSHEELQDIVVWNRDNHIETEEDSDSPGHGTHCLGTFAALTNNGSGNKKGGISGVFPNRINGSMPTASVYCIDNINKDHKTVISTLSWKESLAELLVRNVKVINISEGFGNLPLVIGATAGNENAIRDIYALANPMGEFLHKFLVKGYDFVIVNSAGNDSATTWLNATDYRNVVKVSEESSYGYEKASFWDQMTDEYKYGKGDALYNSIFAAINNYSDVKNRIIVVGATKNNGNNWRGDHKGYSVACFSNWGDRVDVLAPGVDIYSSYISGYSSLEGTSQAAPHVSGVAAMVWSINPTLSGQEVRDIIKQTTSTQITDTLADESHTNGLLDACAAVERAISLKTDDSNTFDEVHNGVLVSTVVRASNSSQRLQGVDVAAYPVHSGIADKEPIATTVSSSDDGQIYMVLPAGTYEIVATTSDNSFLPYIFRTEITADGVTYAEWIKLVEYNNEITQSMVYGIVTNAINGAGVSNATLQFTNVLTGEIAGSTKTTTGDDDGAQGAYTIHLPIGTYKVTATAENYTSAEATVYSLPQSSTGAEEIVMNPILPEGEYRIVLHWDERPSDLDSHIVGSLSSGGRFHVYFSDKNANDNGINVANLDRDDVDSYGPETITLKPTASGTYTYFIHNYTGNSGGTLANSQAWIELYAGSNKVGTYHVPTDQGDGRIWTVFSITDGVISLINTVGDAEPK